MPLGQTSSIQHLSEMRRVADMLAGIGCNPPGFCSQFLSFIETYG